MNFTKLWSFRGGDWTRGFTVFYNKFCDYYCVYFWLLVTVSNSQLFAGCIPSLKYKSILLLKYKALSNLVINSINWQVILLTTVLSYLSTYLLIIIYLKGDIMQKFIWYSLWQYVEYRTWTLEINNVWDYSALKVS